MLQLIRDRAQGVLVWTIVGLIIITFALFGLSSYLTGGGASANVAEVNGTEISENQLLRAQRDYLQRLQQLQGEQFDPSLFDSPRIKQQVLQELISRELIQQHIDAVGYEPAPTQVVNTIQGFGAFQEDGNFSRERYKQILRQEGIPAEQFERDIASDIATEQLRNGVVRSAFVTDAELERFLRLKYQQREIGYLVLPRQRFLEQAEPQPAEIEQFYQDNRQRFMSPEKVRIHYLDLDLERLASQYQVDDSAVEEYYASQRSNYVEEPERRQLQHILIAINAERSQEQARAEAEQLRQQLSEGAAFAELAREHSDDPGSAQQGGKLGTIERGAFDPDFEQSAFTLEEGAISEPVKTRFGYHLIKVQDIQPAKIKPLSEVEEEIRQELRMRQAEQDFYEKVDELGRYSYEMPDSLQGVAEQLGLEVQESPLITRQGGEGLLGHPKVVNAAFSPQVLEQGRNSEVQELSDTRFVVLRVEEHRPAEQKSLQEVRPQIVRQLKLQQAQKLAIEAAQAIREKLAQGAGAEALARQHETQWHSPGFVSRQPDAASASLDPNLRRAAFQMPAPEADQPRVTTTPLPNGDVAVLRLQAMRSGDLPAETSRTSERQRLSAAFGSSEYEALVKSLRRQGEVSINQQRLNEE